MIQRLLINYGRARLREEWGVRMGMVVCVGCSTTQMCSPLPVWLGEEEKETEALVTASEPFSLCGDPLMRKWLGVSRGTLLLWA